MKKILKLLLMSCFIFNLTGCFKSEELDKATIYTTSYPITFLMQEIYGYNSEISSIYPNGTDIESYTLSNKKIKKYSKGDLFVYNGLTDEKKIAANFVNKNSKLKIIDVTEGLNINYSYQELWLNPINYLMLAQNIKNGLKEYIDSTIIKEEIDANYEKIKVTISEFETTLKDVTKNSDKKTIIVSKDYFKFLETYGFEVISVEENEYLNQDTITRAKNLITNKTIKYIFIAENEEPSQTVNSLVDAGAETKTLYTITNLTSEQKSTNEDYVSLMKTNIEALKSEIYN